MWGLRSTQTNVKYSVTKTIEFNTGDIVTFKKSGKLIEGKIIGINENGAIIEYKSMFGKLSKKEVEYDELTKIE